jgi:hypothetical protein
MRNFAAFLGLVVGANVGWLFGTFAEGYSALATERHAGHKLAYVMAFVMAAAFAISLRRIVGDMSARGAAAEAKVEHAAAKIERTRTSTGKTPPAPRPAFQA